MGDHLQIEDTRYSFSLVLKHVLYNRTQALAVNVDRVSLLSLVVGDFLFRSCNLFGLVFSLKLKIELSGIH